MVHSIKAQDVHNLAIRSRKNENLSFGCDTHKQETKNLVAEAINKLVQNSAFKAAFANFLPEESTDKKAQLNVRVTKEALIVEDAADSTRAQTMTLSDLDGSKDAEKAILTTCHTLMQKVDTLYRECMKEGKAHSTHSPMPRTASVAAIQADLAKAQDTLGTYGQWAADAIKAQNLVPLQDFAIHSQLAHNIEHFTGQQLADANKDAAANLPGCVKRDIYHYLYEMKGMPASFDDGDRWSLGEHYFSEPNYRGVVVSPSDRAQAIRLAMLKQLAAHYSHASFKTEQEAAALTECYRTLSQEVRTEIETQLWLLHGTPDVYLYGYKAFFGEDGYSATDPERADAIRHYILKALKS